jgi:hypothetical protein
VQGIQAHDVRGEVTRICTELGSEPRLETRTSYQYQYTSDPKSVSAIRTHGKGTVERRPKHAKSEDSSNFSHLCKMGSKLYNIHVLDFQLF